MKNHTQGKKAISPDLIDWVSLPYILRGNGKRGTEMPVGNNCMSKRLQLTRFCDISFHREATPALSPSSSSDTLSRTSAEVFK